MNVFRLRFSLILGLWFILPSGTNAQIRIQQENFSPNSPHWVGRFEVGESSDGSPSLVLEGSDARAFQVFPLPKGGRYRLQMKVQTSDVGAPGLIGQLNVPHGQGLLGEGRVFLQEAKKPTPSPVLFTLSGASEWRDISVVVEIPGQPGDSVILNLEMTGSGRAELKDLHLTPTDESVTSREELITDGLLSSTAPSQGNATSDALLSHLTNGQFMDGLAGWTLDGLAKPKHELGQSLLELKQGDLTQRVKIETGASYQLSMDLRTECSAEDAFRVTAKYLFGHPLRTTDTDSGRIRFYTRDGKARSAVIIAGGRTDWHRVSGVFTAALKRGDLLALAKENRQKTGRASDYLLTRLKIVQRLQGKEDLDTQETRKLQQYRREVARLVTNDVYNIHGVELTLSKPQAEGQVEIRNISLVKLDKKPNAAQDHRLAPNLANPVPVRLSQGRPAYIPLASKGRAQIRIYVGSADDKVELQAATELADYLEKMTGASFYPLAHDNNPLQGPYLIVGKNNALVNHLHRDLPAETLGSEGFVIRTLGKNLWISGAESRGTLYGVYHLLDNILGIRWFASDYTYIPKASTLGLDPMNVTEAPRFDFREVFLMESDHPIWSAHNRLNGRSFHRSSKLIPPEYGGYLRPERIEPNRILPKSMAKAGQYHWTHPTTLAAAAKYLAKRESSLSDVSTTGPFKAYINIIHNDNGRYFEGGSDGELIRKYQTPGAGYIDFCRQLAEGMNDKTICVMAEAYQFSLKPPVGMDLPANFGVYYAPIQMNYGATYQAPINKRYLEYLRGWCKISKTVFIWDYLTNFSSYLQPHPNLYLLGPNLRTEASFPQVKGVFFQGSYQTLGGEFANLRTWLLSRLLWNPEQDDRALIREFVEGYFGDAAPFILTYIDTMQKSVASHQSYLSIKTGSGADFLDAQTMLKANALFEQAEAAVAHQPAVLKRVQIARLGVDFVMLSRRHYLKKEAETLGLDWTYDVPKRLAAFAKGLELAGVSKVAEGSLTTKKRTLTFLKVERRIPPVPTVCQGLAPDEWVDVQETSFNLTGAEIVEDDAASDRLAASLRGGQSVWGIRFFFSSLNLDPGTWKVYANIRIDPILSENSRMLDPIYSTFLFIRDKKGMFATSPVTLAQAMDNQYHLYEIGEITSPLKQDLYSVNTGGDKSKIKDVYVDRLLFVKQKNDH